MSGERQRMGLDIAIFMKTLVAVAPSRAWRRAAACSVGRAQRRRSTGATTVESSCLAKRLDPQPPERRLLPSACRRQHGSAGAEAVVQG
ncbi:MAG: hypothetical protein WCI74_13860, partial [Actinomycetes bacterium]